MALCVGAMGIVHGACDCELGGSVNNGWVIACETGAQHNPDAPDQICLNRNVDGGVTDEVMSAACSQAANEHEEENPVNPSSFPNAAPYQENGTNAGCTMEEHPFPVYQISDEAGSGDEVGAGSENPNDNAVQCFPQVEIEVTDGDGSYKVATLEALQPCLDGQWEVLAAMEACADRCEEWADAHAQDGYDQFTNPDGNCDPGNFVVAGFYDAACEAEGMGGAIWEASAQLSFADPLNALSATAGGVVAYDDSMCGPSGPCEPEVLMTFSLPSLSFAFMDPSGLVFDVAATHVQLSTLQPTAVTQDPASGQQRIENLEFELVAEDATVDGTSVGPVQFRDIVGPIRVSTDDRSGRRVLTGSSELFRGTLNFDFTVDASRPGVWPAD